MSFFNKFIDKAKHHGAHQHKEKDFQNIQNIQHNSNFQAPLSPTTQADSIPVTTTTIHTEDKHQTQTQPQNPQPNTNTTTTTSTSLPESSPSSTSSSSTKLNKLPSEPSMSTTSHMPMSPPSSTQNSFSLGVDNNLNGARPDIRDMSIDGSDIPHHSTSSSTVTQIASPPSMPLPPAPQVAQPAQVQVKSPQQSQQPSQYAHPAKPAQPQAQFIPVMPLTPQSPPLTPTLPHTSSSVHDPPSTHVPAINIPTAVSTLPASQTKPQRPKLKLADFSLLRTLGTGSFGRVHLAQSKVNQRFYAIKVLKKSEVVRLKQVEHTNNEKAILERVQHPFLVNLWGTFQDDSNLYMVMDYVPGGELFSVLRKSQRFPDHVAKFYAAEVLLAISYLHSKDIIYRDLKPENLLLDAGGHIKITDFGFAKHVPDITWTLCGTPDYLAPEIIQSKGYGKAVDWYSLGVLIFEMLAGYPPFYDDDHLKLYEKILVGKIKWPSYFDANAKDLLKRLLTPDLSKRYGNLKGGVEDIKRHKWFEGVDFNKVFRREIRAPYVPSIRGEGDASHFDRYPEETEPYGQAAPDLFREKFADF